MGKSGVNETGDLSHAANTCLPDPDGARMLFVTSRVSDQAVL